MHSEMGGDPAVDLPDPQGRLQRTTSQNMVDYPHYFKKIPVNVTHIDIYAVLQLWGVTSPAVQHAVKKLLCAGERGAKDTKKDLAEARDSAQRAIDMLGEYR